MRDQRDAFEASVVFNRGQGVGPQLIQELVADGLHAVTRYQPRSNQLTVEIYHKFYDLFNQV